MKWYVEDHCGPDEAEDFPKGIAPAVDHLTVNRLADWCHARRDGWEWSWPKVFVIVDDAGVLHRFEVERHTVPEFEARELPAACPSCSTPYIEVRHHRGGCGAVD
jgi:hypothetical protein